MKNIEKDIIKVLSAGSNVKYNYKQISAKIGAFDKKSRILVRQTLANFLNVGIVREVGRGQYKLNPKYLTNENTGRNYATGHLMVCSNGLAFVEHGKPGENDDIIISERHLSNALNGDLVKVLLFPPQKDRRLEGEVVEVLERNTKPIVGVISMSKNVMFFTPDSPAYRKDFLIPQRLSKRAKNGDKVVVSIIEWGEDSHSPIARVETVLGKPGENDVEMQAILVENDFPLKFPDEVEKAAADIPVEIPKSEIRKRRDFRSVTTFTIDPADAKDFDDAISYEKLDNGFHRIGVHIADVSHYVTPGSIIDQEAYERGTSIYLVDRVIPMLPEILSNNLCSLRPNEDKLCYSAVFDLDDNAKVHREWFGRTVINSDKRFSYDDVQTIIETGNGELSEIILQVDKLAKILRKDRMDNCAINFESEEVKFQLDEKGKPIGVYVKVSKDANWLIEEFMLLANKKVAEKIGKKTAKQKEIKTFVYRVHDEPMEEKVENFKTFAKKLGYDIKTGSRKSLVNSFNAMLEASKETGEADLLSQLTVRLMARAVYSTDNIGHYGLAFPYYTHFTSPIRRYPDIMVHRLLDAYLHDAPSVSKTEYEKYCVHSSQMEQKATEAERSSIKYKQAEYLSDKIGQVFVAKVSGVAKWGIFAELTESKCEGLIAMRKFDDDFYYIDEDNYTLVGLHKGFTLRMGDAIKVRVADVNLLKKQMDFDFVEKINH
ncbi:MAG: ribonuclease R [Bacteroidales bacterium]|nr:ribonuclease R [Bacteroidales bacterium]